MTRRWIIEGLLGSAVALAWLSVTGIAVMRNIYERLHYIAPITTLVTIAVSAAILLEESFSQVGVKVIIIALLLLAINAVLAHSTAWTAYTRSSRRPPPDKTAPRKRGAGPEPR